MVEYKCNDRGSLCRIKIIITSNAIEGLTLYQWFNLSFWEIVELYIKDEEAW